MAIGQTNAMAALLSQVVLALYWLAMLILVLGFVVIGAGIAGSINDGAFQIPLLTAWTDDVPTVHLVLALLETVLFAAALAYVCWELRHILSTLAGGDPFVPENAPRLMRIAIALAVVELIGVLSFFFIRLIFGPSESEALRFSIDPGIVGAVIVLFILAQVFKEGSRLRDADRMTI